MKKKTQTTKAATAARLAMMKKQNKPTPVIFTMNGVKAETTIW
jgi:hypothetical protein